MNETNTGLGNDCCRPIASGPALLELIRSVRAPLAVYKDKHGSLSVYPATKDVTVTNDYSPVATLPPLYPEWLGDRGFCAVHGVRFAYIAGAMARGIASIEIGRAHV